MVAKVSDRIRAEFGEEPFQRSYYNSAARLLIQMDSSVQLPEFLTSFAYTMID
jgi:hypothetical protein